MIISSIIAVAKDGAIGKDGDLPWKLPADLKHFKRTTMGYPVIMGRKCYESIGRPLPGRANVIITRNPDYQVRGCQVVHSIDAAYQSMVEAGHNKVFIIGGAEIYRQTEADWDELYWTEVDAQIEDADTHFHLAHPDRLTELSRENHPADDKNSHAYSFIHYQRR